MKRDSEVVIWRKKAPIRGVALLRSLRKNLKGRVETAYLFGSHTRGKASSGSDIDLFLITDTKRPWPERGKDYFDLIDQFGAVDLLVYTPEEWREMIKNPTPFLRHAKRTWKKIL